MRLEQPLDPGATGDPQAFTASLSFDRRLYREDIAGSIAHARMLARQGILTPKEAELIVMGLASIRQEIQKGEFPWKPEREDIHMNIEARLFEKLGDLAGKLHTARSRNDQIAVDERLFVKKAADGTLAALTRLQQALLTLAEAHRETILPGYTHLQRAQPVLLAHHLLAYFEMLQRDKERFRQARSRANVLPLGSGALAGVPYPVDRESLAQELGFATISANSMDAVSDRDFLLDYEYAAAVTMMHLSRLAEELVLWSTEEFGFVKMAAEYAGGSSIMPQKRNPQVAELVRGKTGRVYGHLLALLTTLKGLPLTYDSDLQEDKEGFFDTVDTLLSCLEVTAGMMVSLHVNKEAMGRAAEASYVLATDLADYLVKKGLPFREAHGVVGRLVTHAQKQGKLLTQLTLEEYRRFSPLFAEDVFAISLVTSLAARAVPGGTAPHQVARALEQARKALEAADKPG